MYVRVKILRAWPDGYLCVLDVASIGTCTVPAVPILPMVSWRMIAELTEAHLTIDPCVHECRQLRNIV